jgi:hypothetical protein
MKKSDFRAVIKDLLKDCPLRVCFGEIPVPVSLKQTTISSRVPSSPSGGKSLMSKIALSVKNEWAGQYQFSVSWAG